MLQQSPSKAMTTSTTVRRWWSVASLVLVLCFAGCGSTQVQALSPGEYTISVILTGGSGRATVESPTKVIVTDDEMVATLTWSSPYYTWMEISGVRYTPISARGENSVFEIPISLDVEIPFSAETTAMSQPHTIEYTLSFDSASARATG